MLTSYLDQFLWRELNVNGRNVLIMEDIIDTGRTLSQLTSLMEQYDPRSIKTICLLDKPDRRDEQVTLKPDYDYDIIGGSIHQHITPVSDVRLWVVAGAVELGALGLKEFVGGLNMKYMGINEQIETDGRASARMNKTTTGVPYQTNQLQYIITHNAGHQHELMLVARLKC